MRNLKEEDIVKVFFFFFCSVIKLRCVEDEGMLIFIVVEIFVIKIKGSKSFVYSFFFCLDWIM